MQLNKLGGKFGGKMDPTRNYLLIYCSFKLCISKLSKRAFRNVQSVDHIFVSYSRLVYFYCVVHRLDQYATIESIIKCGRLTSHCTNFWNHLTDYGTATKWSEFCIAFSSLPIFCAFLPDFKWQITIGIGNSILVR